jgi:hypothetical protein
VANLDESGFEKETLRDYGYAIEAHVVWIHLIGKPKGEPTSLGQFLAGFYSIGLFEFNVNANVFYGWVVQCLLPPALPSNSVVVMDKCLFS